jgi:hypothetical protein
MVGTVVQPHGDTGAPFEVERVARLDDVPRIATMASRRGMQNPDFILIGSDRGSTVLQAADAKFSVETARSKQVSQEMIETLLTLGPVLGSLTGDLGSDIRFVPGVFLSPDFTLTHLMLGGRQGITRATVRPAEVHLIPVDPGVFFAPLPASSIMPVLARIDSLPVSIEESLLAGLYYFRLARAAVGAWMDSVKPLLFMNDHVDLDEEALYAETVRRSLSASSAFGLVLDWDVDVEHVRARRASVDQVTGLPVMSRDLRNAIAAATAGIAGVPPSVNLVRRRLGAWFRGELRAQFGPIPPDTPDFPGVLSALGLASRSLGGQVPSKTTEIIAQIIEERANASDDDGEPAANGADEERAERSEGGQLAIAQRQDDGESRGK